MDWQTHVVLSARLLESCGLDLGAALYANLPVIDAKPAHYHRVYAHILCNQPSILEAAMELFGSPAMQRGDFRALDEHAARVVAELRSKLPAARSWEERNELDKSIYAYTRVAEEAPVFKDLADKAAAIVGNPAVSRFTGDRMSAAISLASHLFFDVYNNPVQAFLPDSPYCSGQWEFWDRVDYLRFRGDFYSDPHISDFRNWAIALPIWGTRLDPSCIVKSIIIRLGELGQPAIHYEVIDWAIRTFLRYLDVKDYRKVDVEIAFCRELEAQITRWISERFPKGIERHPSFRLMPRHAEPKA
jgi:hypothetical protein